MLDAKQFAGQLIAFDTKTDEENVDTVVVVAMTDNAGGYVELACNDRNERMYLKFRLSDFRRALKAAP
jgi:hypothetical protein